MRRLPKLVASLSCVSWQFPVPRESIIFKALVGVFDFESSTYLWKIQLGCGAEAD